MVMFSNGHYDSDLETHRSETLIGRMVKVDGTLVSQGNITIDGEFKGTLDVGGKLTVGKEAMIEAQVKAKDAFVAGTLQGNITVVERLDLAASAKITGDVHAGVLVMEAGAFLNGNCTMSGVGPSGVVPVAEKSATSTKTEIKQVSGAR